MDEGMGEDSEIHEKWEMGNIGHLPAKAVEQCLHWHVTFKDEGFVWQQVCPSFRKQPSGQGPLGLCK